MEEEFYYPPPQTPPPSYGAPQVQSIMQRNQEFSKWLLNNEKELKKLECRFRGLYFDNNKRKYVRLKGIKPMINDEGCNILLTILSSRINKTLEIANFNDEKANKQALQLCREIVPLIYAKHKDWEIEKYYVKTIINIIDDTYTTCLTHPLGEGIRKFLSQTEQTNRQVVEYPHENISIAQKFLGMFKRRK